MIKYFVRPDVRNFLDLMNGNPRPPLSPELVAQIRAQKGIEALFERLDLPLGDIAATRDLVMPAPTGGIRLRLFDCRETREPGPLVVFFHGGGHVLGSIESHASLCAEISRQLDLPIVSVDYRLAPEHRWPAAPDDAEAAARWISQNGADFGRRVTALVLCGDSAGANLALVTGLALRDDPARVPVILQIVFYPATDMSGRYPSAEAFGAGYQLDEPDLAWFRHQYKPDGAHWRASPLHADLSRSPQTVVVTAGLDPQRDQGRAYAAKLIQAGVPTAYLEAAGTIHGFANYRQAIPSARQDLAHALAVARKMLS